jgi:hypothetical protein
MKIFTNYKDIASEKTFIQQHSALNYELELLKQQLTKINRLLNDTIVEKTKKEINLQTMQLQTQQNNIDSEQNFKKQNYYNNTNDEPTMDVNKPRLIQPDNSNHQIHNSRNSFNSRDLIREKRRSSIGRTPNYTVYQAPNERNTSTNKTVQNFNENYITVQHTNGTTITNGLNNNNNKNTNKTSAMERLFGSQRNIEQMIMNKPDYKKVAHVKPEIRNEEKYNLFTLTITFTDKLLIFF